jgi:hypothetical protein
VQQSVHTAEVHKNSVFGDVLDDPIDFLTLVDRLQSGGTLGLTLGLEDNAPGKDDVAAFAVVFEDLEHEGLADEFVQISNRSKIRLRSRKKSIHADIDRKTAFDAADDGPLDGFVSIVGFLNLFPDFYFFSFFFRQHDDFIFIVPPLDHYFHLIIDFGVDFTVFVSEFVDSDLASDL